MTTSALKIGVTNSQYRTANPSQTQRVIKMRYLDLRAVRQMLTRSISSSCSAGNGSLGLTFHLLARYRPAKDTQTCSHRWRQCADRSSGLTTAQPNLLASPTAARQMLREVVRGCRGPAVRAAAPRVHRRILAETR